MNAPASGSFMCGFVADVLQIPISWSKLNECVTGSHLKIWEIGGVKIDCHVQACSDFFSESSAGVIVSIMGVMTLYVHVRYDKPGKVEARLYVLDHKPSFRSGVCEMYGHNWEEVRAFIRNKVQIGYNWDAKKQLWEKMDVVNLD